MKIPTRLSKMAPFIENFIFENCVSNFSLPDLTPKCQIEMEVVRSM